MNPIQEIFRTHGGAYLARYGDAAPHAHRKVIRAIQQCGTPKMGTHLFACDDCRDAHRTGSSCGNRHCPVCQAGKSDDWLRKQLEKALPVTYFMVTFTVPEQARRLIRSNQKIGYTALFNAAAQSMKTLAKDARFVGCDMAGFTGVLHTWTRQLEYHPHIHFIVPGGGLDADAEQWKPSGQSFYIHERPLSKMYRGKFMDELKQAGLAPDPAVWGVDWVVDVQNVGDGENALTYLAQYIFRIAIAPSRIVEATRTHITFKYKNSDTGKWHTCTLKVFEFMRRYLQHVLPHGFTKIRHYGFMSPNCKVTLRRICELITHWLIELGKRLPPKARPKPPRKKKPWVCEHCGGTILWHKFTPPKNMDCAGSPALC